MFNRRGQTILEYTIIVIILIGVFVAMQFYIKRGIQGRWKTSIDDLGEQYDPNLVRSKITHTVVTNSDTAIIAVNGILTDGTKGQWTNRIDTSSTVETKTGSTIVGE